MQNSENSQNLTLAEEIKQGLPDATNQQIQELTIEVQRLNHLKQYLEQYVEDREANQEQLELAAKALNYKQPYRIAIIGKTGAGKSTMINALLGRSLVLARQGKAATGTAMEIFLDVSETGQEIAIVTYRDESNICNLVHDFAARYKVATTSLPANLDSSYAQCLRELHSGMELLDQTLKEFEELRENLASMVEQFINYQNQQLRRQYSLDSEVDRSELLQLTDEDSSLNRSENRMISLIKMVAYHIKPHQTQDGGATLQLPKQVCLVDLPGLDGSALHNIIISEGIREADAVVFIARPPRILEQGDEYLLDRVRKFVGQGGNLKSGERIFFVLNARDHIIEDQEQNPEKLLQSMQDLIELTTPGYARHSDLSHRGGETPYFLTSAWAAYSAQRQLAKTNSENDRSILESSQIPRLAIALSKFARENRINGQIRDGRRTLDALVESLYAKYTAEKQQYLIEHGNVSPEREFDKSLRKQEEALEQIIIGFHAQVENDFEQWKEQCIPTIKTLCDETDRELQSKLPQMWQEASHLSVVRLPRAFIEQTSYSQILGAAEIFLWKQLIFRVPRLADRFVKFYVQSVQTDLLVQHIADRCYGHIQADDLDNYLKEWIHHMHTRLSSVGERIALTMMTDPTQSFATADQSNKNPLMQGLEQISRQPSLNVSSFAEFIAAVRKHYQPSINSSMIALLNLFRYEMLIVEDQLLDYVRNVFDTIRSSHDPIVMRKVLKDAGSSDIQRLEQIDSKLAVLVELRSETELKLRIVA